ncbi:MAG: glycosyltransferase family 39 protein [Betaproteobacteria bacterium]|nr:glycosyltransferase family 39 protein [Betaproteobacteria bacterium]
MNVNGPLPLRLVKHFSLAAFCIVWASLGLFGHDPWKPDEAYTFGLAYDIAQSGQWIVPTLAGEPFMEKPPLFVVTAAFFAQLTRGFLPLHDGARLATLLYVALTLLFLGRTGRELNGKGFAWLPALLLVGAVGMAETAHRLLVDNALLCGLAMGLYGLALAPRRPYWAGFWLGTGAGIAFMAKGLLGPGLLALTGLLLPIFPHWREWSLLRTVVVALLAALPWVGVWPLLLYERAPLLFNEWLVTQNLGRFFGTVRLGPESDHTFYLKNIAWIAWPAFPLAAWTIWTAVRGYMGGFNRPGIQLPLLFFVIALVVLSFAADARMVYALPLLLPLCVLASASIDVLPRGASSALDWFGILTFGLGAIFAWLAWTAFYAQWPPALHEYLIRFRPAGAGLQLEWLPLSLAVFFTLVWFAIIRPARQSPRRSVLNWAVGMALVWGLYSTILLSVEDSGRSYRAMILEIQKVLPARYDCLASRGLGEPQRALLDYFIGVRTERVEVKPAATCSLLLDQGSRSDDSPEGPDGNWRIIWEGNRPGDNSERFRLYQRSNG